MAGATSRNKGKRREREFLNLLGELLGIRLDRNQNQSAVGGADCISLGGWAIEIKGCEAASFPKWWRQAERQALDSDRKPALAWKRSRKPWIVWLSGDRSQQLTIEEFAAIIRESMPD